MENDDSILSDIETPAIESTYWQRLFTNIIDWLVEVGLFVGIYWMIPLESIASFLDDKPYMTYVVLFILIFAYRFICLLSFEKTVGMMICGIKYLDASLQPLSAKQKMIAAVAIRTSTIRLYKN